MLLVKTCLLKKEGSSVTHWRQITLLMASDTEVMEIKTYYGRSIKTLKPQEEFRYDLAGQAHRDFDNIISYRTEAGYEEIELLCVPDKGLRLAAYKPPLYSTLKGDALTEKFNDDEELIALPIKFGQRAILKIGCESMTSITAISAVDGSSIEIPEKLSLVICDHVKLGQFENGIFEVFLGKKSVTFIDVVFVNGMPLKGGYVKRNQFMKGIFKECDSITITSYVSGSQSLVSLDNPNRDLDVRAYLFKPLNDDFSPSEQVDVNCFIAANYFKAHAMVDSVIGNKSHYEIYCTKDNKAVCIGRAAPPANKNHPIGDAVVYFTGMLNGLMVNGWLSPHSGLEYGEDEADFTQFDDLATLWQG